MNYKPIYITTLLLLFFLSGRAQKIEELTAVPLQIGYEKTLHLIFPTEVKYYSIGGDYVIGEKVVNCPGIIRLKAAEENFPGETTLSVVTADTKFYSYSISYNAHPAQSYVRIGGEAPTPHTLPVGKEKQLFLIFPAGITYVDYGSTNVEVDKAEGVDNILAVKAVQPYKEDTNISVVLEGGKFYTFDLRYVPAPERFSFVIDKEDTQRVAILDEKERSYGQKERIREAVAKRTPLDLGLRDKNSGMEFEVGNIFIDGDVLLLRMTLTNRTQIGYTTDFMRFYIQDAKIRKKTAVQQLEQNILFTFDYPEEIPAHESRTFTVAMNKFTIPDKKRLIIEIQERNGGRHFLYKLKNKSLLTAEEVFRSRKQQETEDEADETTAGPIAFLSPLQWIKRRKGTTRQGTGKVRTPGDTGKLPGYTLPVRSVRQDSAHLSPERQVQEE